MLILLSPAKSLDYDTPPTTSHYTQPQFLERAAPLIELLRRKSPQELASLMGISDALAVLNAGRYQQWAPPFHPGNAKQAVLAFDGDVYTGLDARTLQTQQLGWVQDHVRILSGLYGLLRPLDLIQPYRLEMGTRLANSLGRDLYAYWRETLTARLREEVRTHATPVIVNCASEEYSGAVDFPAVGARVVQTVFKDWKNGQYKIISFYAKQARGLFARYAAQLGADGLDDLRGFDLGGYRFDASTSATDHWVFLRRTDAAAPGKKRSPPLEIDLETAI